ncbi:ABC transporter substrate-binding protein [Schaalia suimastitidis]|uniref:ABC transporter substrate-binding protein n=1 Tax=Schaalia suimastitidis TaxID=121163 RepID=UPI0003FD6CBE|nr:ABC transporter substrate-binding protein [Schaalia suimastitidis]
MPGALRGARRLAATATLTAAIMGMAACAPSSVPSTATSSQSSSATTLSVGLPGSLSTLDVAQEAGILNYYVAQLSSEGLLGVDGNGALIPALAQSWETTDGQTWNFTLRDGVKFHDGTDVTIDDVLFSIEVARDPERSPSTAVYWPEGVNVAANGDNGITITLPAPAVNFGWTVTSNGGLWITSKAYYEAAQAYGSSTDLIMGTGPYKPVAFQPDSHATFERVDTWWGTANDAAAHTVEFAFFSDESTRLLAQQSGEIDVALQVPAAQTEQYGAITGAKAITLTDRSYVGLTFDAGVAPFDDIHVRRAIAYAIDREAIVSSILQGRGEVATSIESPEQLGTEIGVDAARDLIAGLPTYNFNLDKAKEELAQSSVPQGFDAELLYPNSIPELGTAALAIADNLKGLGINLTVTDQPVEQWISTLGTGDYGISYMSYTPTTGDAVEISGWLLGPGNPARYVNDEVQSLIAASTSQTDATQRATDAVAATKIALDDLAYAPMWWGAQTTVLGPKVSASELSPYFFMTPWALSLPVTQ